MAIGMRVTGQKGFGEDVGVDLGNLVVVPQVMRKHGRLCKELS